MFLGPHADVQVHVFSVGCPGIDRMLRFRDRLRADEQDGERYAAAKRALAARTWRYAQHYADAKSDVVEESLRGHGRERRREGLPWSTSARTQG